MSAARELAVWDSSHVPFAAEAQETIDRLHDLFGCDVRLSEITETGGIIIEPVLGDDEPLSAEPDR